MTVIQLLPRKSSYHVLTLIFLVLVTLATSAQWASSQEEEGGGIPAYNAGPPPKGTKLPPVLTKDQLVGRGRADIPTRLTPTNWPRRFRPCCTSSPATAIATAWVTTACTAALRTRTAHAALLA